MANFKYIAHVIALMSIVVGAGVLFFTIRREGENARATGNSTGAFFIDMSAYLTLVVAAFVNQWVAYKFYQAPVRLVAGF